MTLPSSNRKSPSSANCCAPSDGAVCGEERVDRERTRKTSAMKLPLRFIALVFLVLSLSTRSSPQSAPSQGAQQFAELGDFRLEDGSVNRDFRLGYRTLGKLNAEKSNAILWPSWLG